MVKKTPNKKTKIAKRKKLKDLSTDEFFSHGLDSDISSDDAEENLLQVANENEKNEVAKPSTHKKSLTSLEEKDPEFFKFLKENDEELLEFDESDDEEDGENSNDGEDDDEDGSGNEDLLNNKTNEETIDEEEAMDSDMEDRADKRDKFSRDGELVDLKDLAKLKKGLEKNSLYSLRKLLRIFHDAVAEASDEKDEKSRGKIIFKVESSMVFNNLVQLCLKSASSVLQHHLSSEKGTKKTKKPRLPSESKQWSKVKVTVKNYLSDLLQLLRQLSEPGMVAVVLRHVQDLVPYYSCFSKVAKMLVKRLVRMWSSAEEHVRVLSFLCLRKIAIAMPQLYETIIKQLYVGFVKHAKFMNFKTKPVIAFMQNSMVEMFAMDHSTTYQFAFVYIRQMAIHLRNALSTKKKDAYQTVYNWQYINCIQLWTRVVGELHGETLAPLIYPVVQVTLGVVRLIPTARYYPLRFHCLRSLNMLSKLTNTYIPVASYLVEILESSEFNKKSKPSTAKAPDISCALKLPKAQLHTKAFQDCVMENVTELLLEHFVNHSTSIAFPELIFPICLRMKRFMKKSTVPKFSKQIKQIVDKLQEAGHELSRKRSSVNFSPKDIEEVKNWEIAYAQQKNTLQKFNDTWLKMKAVEKANRNGDDVEYYQDESSGDEEEPKSKKRKRTGEEEASKVEKKKEKKSQSVKEKTKSNLTNGKAEKFEDVIKKGLQKDDVVEDFVLSSDED
ncbi:nucleolar complex protein 2 homolog isoform X1 [Rhopilema esculentum]|uniref:nucleolar complex protein 2 homolog isoform X1 n=1 Tax=Rhopilema esculentum TaxID=499914 RepID=UPI0031E0BC24|eukprot:gene6992-12614_t